MGEEGEGKEGGPFPASPRAGAVRGGAATVGCGRRPSCRRRRRWGRGRRRAVAVGGVRGRGRPTYRRPSGTGRRWPAGRLHGRPLMAPVACAGARPCTAVHVGGPGGGVRAQGRHGGRGGTTAGARRVRAGQGGGVCATAAVRPRACASDGRHGGRRGTWCTRGYGRPGTGAREGRGGRWPARRVRPGTRAGAGAREQRQGKERGEEEKREKERRKGKRKRKKGEGKERKRERLGKKKKRKEGMGGRKEKEREGKKTRRRRSRRRPRLVGHARAGVRARHEERRRYLRQRSRPVGHARGIRARREGKKEGGRVCVNHGGRSRVGERCGTEQRSGWS
ncbi:hypothetical protein PAHAL_5G336700 [Panicum hallii]|uniref:Uncharacterized protein n=1 Tax=Panicum hallii TaxID=206008 RepID=A0A2T8IM32_9POAL|nr:hypothetical protein PAHAL_5G336700 [Panicum hallii]